jgi:NADPH:quinone reductase-like Zn-dependent oxidoreductase
MAASRIYDYPGIRQMAGFLEKELLKQQWAPVQSMSPHSLDDVLQQVQQGTLETGKAEQLVHQLFHTQGMSSPLNRPASTYQCVVVERSSGIDDLLIAEAEMPELGEHEVRVAVHAFSLNFGDLLCVKGLYPTMPPYPFTPGFDASGVVLEVGRAVTAFQIGDPVMAVAGPLLGAQASVMTCPEAHVFHKPVTLSFEEAAALPAAAITMVAAFEKARLKRGEKILIQTATGGTGLIAIQLATYYGAHIYATAGSQAKLDYLKELGVPYQINYRERDFEKEIERLTEGKGVDVVINTLSGDALQKGMNCLAPGGRYIEIAMTALKSARTIDLSVFNQNQTFYSVDLRRLAQTDPAALKRYGHEMLQVAEEGIITPTICQVFAWERLKDAYRYMEDRQHIGKIVVRIPEGIQMSQSLKKEEC